MCNHFSIRNKIIGPGNSSMVIAEVGMAHDGSLGLAHAFINAIASAGADAVKFQTHIADAESTPMEKFRVKFTTQDRSRYDYWKRTEFNECQWKELALHAKDRGLAFMSSPFSSEAVDLLERVGVDAWKIASGEVNNPVIFERIANTGLPVILSTGMSTLKEIDGAVNSVKTSGLPLAVLQCTSMYPCPPEKIGLNMIPFFRERYNCASGLSDHSGKIFPGIAASLSGLEILEVHVILSRDMFGPDVSSSLTTEELRYLVEGVRFVEKMRASPIDKEALASETSLLRDLFTKSVVAARELSEGAILAKEDLAVKKPGTGIPAMRLSDIIGRRLKRSVHANELLAEEDLEAN